MARRASIPFFALHFLPLLLLFTGINRTVVLFILTFTVRMFFITAGYHRYFSHRSYRMAGFRSSCSPSADDGRAEGPALVGAHHREHHRYSDTDPDPHSPHKGFWWSHVGWILSAALQAADRRRHPGLRQVPGAALHGQARLGRAVVARRGLLPDRRVERPAGRLLPVDDPAVALDVLRQLGHPLFGPRRYATDDTSRNSLPIALMTMR